MARRTTEEKAQQTVQIADRRRRVAALVLARARQKDIARQEKVSPATICTDVAALHREWKAARVADTDTQRVREEAALDADELAWRERMQRETDPDRKLRIYDRIAKIMDSRRKLLGLDAPTKQEVSGPGGSALLIQVNYADPDPDDHLAPLAPRPADGASG